MAWGYRLEVLGSRDGARCREDGKGCSVGQCDALPQYLSAYRYSRVNGRAVTVTRTLCVKHARLFSMKYSLAWPGMFRGIRRPATVARSLYNGLERVAAARHPQVHQMQAALLAAGALGAAMSGSGLTVFGVARSFDHARQLRARVARASWECWAVRSLQGPAIRTR